MNNHDEALLMLRCATDAVAKSSAGLETAAKQEAAAAEAEEVEKSLRAKTAHAMARADRLHDFLAGIAQVQPVLGTTRVANEWEPPVIPVRKVCTPDDDVSKSHGNPYTTCVCGVIIKSQGSCPRCRDAHSIKETQTPKWVG